MSVLPGPSRVFSLQFEDRPTGLSSYVAPAIKIIDKTYNSVKHFVGFSTNETKEEQVDEPNGVTLGYITRSISDENVDDQSNSQQSNLPTDLNDSQLYLLWCNKLNSSEAQLSDYQKLSVQWKTLLKVQWEHSFALRSFTVSCEAAIEQSHILSKSPYDQLSFNVLISLFTFHFSRVPFNSLFIPFLEIIIQTFIKSNDGTDSFIMNDDKTYNLEETSSICFWAFKTFSEIFLIVPKKKNPIQEMYLGVKTTLQMISPSTASMLQKRKINSLDFCSKDINNLFVRDRTLKESQMYLTALILADDKTRFLQCTLCAVLALMQERLEETPEGDINAFQRMFESQLPTIDMKLILYNVKNLMGFKEDEEKHEI
ncbi:hypothetical protein GPJ56_003447 [Histomonas meleagridis]|uniref:uncharacterized protein n=1 Tax=Histomonas meleagridis TaxID=135588 RepID=UPI00355A5908|nr:hypothetical protein GPJ56_003447 [Histomonas meleagridis]KAH0799139.1 hypothetical protein GO595_007936 [Histomonas meleagridis]